MAPHPVVLADAQKAEVETLAAVLSVDQIADYFGIGRTTFYALLQRDHDIAERYKRGKARAIGAVANSLITQARAGNITAMIFYLKTQGGWRETSVLEHAGLAEATSSDDTARRKLLAIVNGFAERMAQVPRPVAVGDEASGGTVGTLDLQIAAPGGGQ